MCLQEEIVESTSAYVEIMAYSDRTYMGMGPGLIQCQSIDPFNFPHKLQCEGLT